MMEQGLVEGSTIKYHLKQYLRRSFSVGGTDRELQIDALERSFTLNGRRLEMSVQAMTNFGNDDYTATYSKLL
uniref:Uncharacterized protein n=1 Tax=Plectus sambesii TaxID=2011161 RepID=A0A914US87_9BILA